MLEVRLLGKFEVRYKKNPVTISSRPAQSLLAYLILSAGTSHRREKLAGLLWPDSLEETARENLRHALWRLRKALETASSTRFLHANDVTIGFKESPDYWLDTAELQKLGAKSSADELIAVLSSYQGELLPGFYDEWVISEREHLNSIFEYQMARLMSLLQEEKCWLDILDWGERWIKLGQKPEPAYRALMAAHAAKGDMSKLAATYERCAKALKEFGLEPSEQTRTLFEKLRARKETFETGPSIPLQESRKESSKTNLPVPITSFIGREQEVEEIIKLLEKNRLITLTGSGGVGKTRLAIETSRKLSSKFKDGVWWVDLVGLNDPSLVPQAVAQVLNVHETPNVPLIEILANVLPSRQTLLVLDNCEHLIAACAQLAESLLGACGTLKMLTTSREALDISGEIIWRVPSLSFPVDSQLFNMEELEKYESVRLFIERAQAVRTDFNVTEKNVISIIQICQKLDGIPLAVELAAARIKLLSPGEIATRLNDRFNLLTTGSRTALPRQQTLHAAIDWSYDLLNGLERILFHRLSTFAGGFNLQAAEQVCMGDGIEQTSILQLLAQLVDKSLVIVDFHLIGGETRYRLLETIREYAFEKLIESGEEHIVRSHHMEFFSRLATDAEPNLFGAETLLWVNRLEAEHENLLAAIDWSLKSENPDFALCIVGALVQWDSWHNSEGADRSLQVVRSPLTRRRTVLRAKALHTAGIMQWFQGNNVQARALLDEAVAIGNELANKEFYYVWSLATLGIIAATEGDDTVARAYLEEGLAEARKLGVLGAAAVGFSLAYLGDVFILQGDRARARQSYEESAVQLRKLNNKNFLGYPLRRLAELALDRAEYENATTLYEESLSLNFEEGDRRAVIASLAGLAAIAAKRGQVISAARLYAAVESLLETISAKLLPTDQRAYDRNVTMLRSQLDEAIFNAIWAEGRAMILEQAIEFALKETAS